VKPADAERLSATLQGLREAVQEAQEKLDALPRDSLSLDALHGQWMLATFSIMAILHTLEILVSEVVLVSRVAKQ
jgi:hypothetical protein